MVVFIIIGKTEPIYELEIGKALTESGDDLSYLHQFILYSSLDMVNSSMWTNNSTFLKVVDKFNYLYVSSYVSQGGKIFLILHNGKGEDAIRAFFVETHELYVRYLMNPFASSDTPIISPHFNATVRALAKRLLL
mmetsp:Transcript_4626/g.5065  ORF Transcript_4626/g.5065 Transcript_4626/m.5065 type:complete len:135 (+) Transcript_4626:76-480(+)